MPARPSGPPCGTAPSWAARCRSAGEVAIRHVSSRSTVWAAQLSATGRLSDGVARAEQAGLTFAFRARLLAILVVFVWLLLSVEWPRNVYYACLAVGYFVLGYIPYRLRHHRFAEPIKLAFVVLDVTLVTVSILMPPPGDLSIDWPVQTRLRGQVFLFLLLLLPEAALTYSPRRVLWTGASILAIWSSGFVIINDLPGTLRYADVLASGARTDAEFLRMYVDPTYVSVASWSTQVVAIILFTVLTTLAVLRSRMHLVAEAKAEVGRSDLARYVSPDVAVALADQVSSGFGEPATREVAVLFADIVGFTGLSERLSPERTFALLNSFQERSSRVVIDHRGTLDKFLGDGLMATFGALRDERDAPARAIECAFALCKEVERWNAKRRERGTAAIRIAIGVHCGPVMVGNLGSDRRIEFTVVGDVVNVTSRLEKACRELECLVVVSDDCIRAAGSTRHRQPFERVVEVRLRGRANPLSVHLAGQPSGVSR